jgi:large subunit ribosomal protein L1
LHRKNIMPSKRYNKAQESQNGEERRGLQAAIGVLAGFPKAKFDETVELSFRMGVDPKYSDQMVVVAFTPEGAAADAAKAAGAEHVGFEELIKKVEGGWTGFDVAVATPEAMKGGVSKLGRQLGPRGLMPNPKTGTVTEDLGKAVTAVKAGRVEFKVDKTANLHVVVGKVSFTEDKLLENARAVVDSVMKARPDGFKGTYLQSCTISATMSPGVKVDTKDLGKQD